MEIRGQRVRQANAERARRAADELETVIRDRGWKGRDSLGGQLSGDWWQVTLARGKEEMSALSFVSIEQEAPRIVSIEGTALTAEGKNHAIFKSLATRLREDEKTLFYYWEGTWPGTKRIGFFGKGEITLDSAQNAHGFFTVSALDDAGMREHLETRFFRATAEESSVMNGDDSVLRNATVVRQLQRRESLAFD